MNNNQFSAGPALLGYLYQCRIALTEALKRLIENPSLIVYIEALDDVHFESDGKPIEIIQTKHHINRSAELSDYSSDIWKTLRVWCSSYNTSQNNNDTIRYLITTNIAKEGTAAYYLKNINRDVEKAEKLLSDVALTSSNKSLVKEFNSFRVLSKSDRINILESVIIIDNAIDIHDITNMLNNIFWSACPRDKISLFTEYLEGWWLRRILDGFAATSGNLSEIIAEEIDSKINSLRESFKSDSLPIDDHLITATVDHDLYKNYTFVEQLKLINIGSKRIPIAVNNYYRALEQRSRWVREDLLIVGDIDDYETRLIEEWNTRFLSMVDELGEEIADSENIKHAQKLYKWAEQDANYPIKPNCHEIFITRGSLQMLSDKKKIGWHPNFSSLLEAALTTGKEI